MNLIFWLIFVYLLAIAISVYAVREYEYWYGLGGCVLVFIALMYLFGSKFLAVMMFTGSVGYILGYKYLKSTKKATMVCITTLIVTALPMIAIWYFIKHGESVETSYILDHKLDNLYRIV